VFLLQSRVLGSSSRAVSPDGVLSLDLSSLLSVLSHAESALQWRHEELQVGAQGARPTLSRRAEVKMGAMTVCVCVCVPKGAELSLRRLHEEKTAVELRLKQLEDDNQLLNTHSQHTQLELTHTLDLLSRYTHTHTHTQINLSFSLQVKVLTCRN